MTAGSWIRLPKRKSAWHSQVVASVAGNYATFSTSAMPFLSNSAQADCMVQQLVQEAWLALTQSAHHQVGQPHP